MRTIRVGVFEQKDTKRRPMAYTTWYNPDWLDCCEHTVQAPNGKEAKKIAVDEHIAKCRKDG